MEMGLPSWPETIKVLAKIQKKLKLYEAEKDPDHLAKEIYPGKEYPGKRYSEKGSR